MRMLLALLLLLPVALQAAGLGVYNPAQHAVNGFMPTQLPNCYFWATAASCQLTNGASVIDAFDYSQNAMTINTLSSAKRPTIGQINGRQCFVFDGVDDGLRVTNFNSYTASWDKGMSMWVVTRFNSGSDIRVIAENETSPSGSGFSYDGFVIQDLKNADDLMYFARGPEKSGFSFGGAYIQPNSLDDNVFRVIGGSVKDTHVKFHYNGNTAISGTNAFKTNKVSASFWLGYNHNTSSRYLSGAIAECIVIGGDISDYQLIQVQRYLGTKYGIVVK